MGNTINTWASAFAGFDLPGDSTVAKPVLRKKKSDAEPASGARLKPRNPLHFVQISQAWEEIGRVCKDFHGENFDIEQDLNLQKPIKIAILDTGVYQDHAALVGRVSRVRNFVSRHCQADAQEDLTRDRHGHGTFCAALAVGGRYKVKYQPDDTGEPESLIFQNGVAPFAKV
jgi:subtilisin family serine protease